MRVLSEIVTYSEKALPPSKCMSLFYHPNLVTTESDLPYSKLLLTAKLRPQVQQSRLGPCLLPYACQAVTLLTLDEP